MRIEASVCFSVWRGCSIKNFHLVVLLSVLGGFFKIVSGVFFGSKAALVDALTSIVNVVAALVAAKYENMSLMPPDKDHHYGHKRMFVGGSMFSISLYSLVGGAMLVDLIHSGIGRYEVHILATVFATLGALPYLTAILISKKMGGSFGTYAKFTMVEIIECLVVIASSLGGAIVNYLIDLTGASLLLIYLYVEIVREARGLLHVISDKAPIYLTEKIRKILEDLDIEIRSIRVREIVPGKYHGDMVIALPAETTVEKAHEVAHVIERSIKALGIDVDIVVHVEPT
ncbi:MAG: cation transporter [Sulfolobales archaeon]